MARAWLRSFRRVASAARRSRFGSSNDLLQALNTGHSGTLSTIHSNSAEQALARFSSCVVQSGVELPHQAVRYQIADAIDLVLHLARTQGARVVRQLIRINRYDAERDRYEADVLFSDEGIELMQLRDVGRKERVPRMPANTADH